MLENNNTTYTRSLRNLRFQIGQNIHRRRSELQLPLEKFSSLIGVSAKILDQYEMGNGKLNWGSC